MNDEIKEILKDMDLVVNYDKVPIYYTQKQIKILLDYITNLQEENKRLSVELNQNMIERNNYLSRCEKAIEFIKECQLGVDSMDRPVMLLDQIEGRDLLKILGGDE